MFRADRVAVAVLLLAAAHGFAAAQPGTRTEKRRKQILDQLGVPKRPAPADAGATPPAPAPAAEAEAAPAPGAAAPATRVRPGFTGAVHAALLAGCRSCHAPGASAGNTRFLLRGAARADHEAARAAGNALISKAAGEAHGGGVVWARGTRQLRQVQTWLSAGARLEPVEETVPAGAPTATPPARTPRPRRATAPATPPAPPVAVPAPNDPAPAAAPDSGAPVAPGATPAAPPAVAGPDFATAVLPLLTAGCMPCHNAGGSAATSRLLLRGDATADHAAARPFVDPARPADSALLTKGAGVNHGGGVIYPPDSQQHRTLIAWVRAGATARNEAPVAAPAPTGDAPPPAAPPLAPAPTAMAPPTAAPPPAPAAGRAQHAGVRLPFGLHLNGRFDLAYERRGLGRDTSFGEGQNALRSYHQFLFLSRQDTQTGLGFTVELIGLQLWEATFTHHFQRAPLSVVARAGKILVPFGTEPLFHQLYGGLVGFDQRMLPPVWAQEGISEQLVAHVGPVSLSSDLYVVRGYRLRQGDAVLNLQSDFSAADDARLGFGHRAGTSWSAVTAYYSTYLNGLGFGRRLFMQAVDVSVGRFRQLPVAGRLALMAGFLRADVSGGGAGRDYYHFGSYWQARFYAMDWLYLQYRQGLRTFNNRRGNIVDETRLEANDGSSHIVGVGARWRGVSALVQHVINLEKADETDDDFFRAAVAFEF